MGEDKAMCLFHGKPLISYVLKLAETLSRDIYILSNHQEHEVFGYPLLNDHFKNTGAAGGIDAMLHHQQRGEHLLMSCDAPMVDVESFHFLFTRHIPGSITVFRHNEYPEPLLGIYSSQQAGNWRRGLEHKTYKLSTLLQGCRTNYISASKVLKINPLLFSNTNSKNDLLSLEKLTMTVQCYGIIREIIGAEIMVVEKVVNEEELRTQIYKRFPRLQKEPFTIAVNRRIISSSDIIPPDSEIALLPPFSGG